MTRKDGIGGWINRFYFVGCGGKDLKDNIFLFVLFCYIGGYM